MDDESSPPPNQPTRLKTTIKSALYVNIILRLKTHRAIKLETPVSYLAR